MDKYIILTPFICLLILVVYQKDEDDLFSCGSTDEPYEKTECADDNYAAVICTGNKATTLYPVL